MNQCHTFLQQLLFKFLINLFKDQCGVNPTVCLYLFKTKNIFSWCHFKIDQWSFKVLILIDLSSFFCLKLILGGIFYLKNLSFSLSIYCFFFVRIKKILIKLSKSKFLINISGHEFVRIFVWKFLLIRSCVWYLIFHLLILLWPGNFLLLIPVSMFHFYCHYYFHYVHLWDYKGPLLGSGQSSTNNQIYTTHKHKSTMDRFLNILEENQPKPEESIDETKVKYIASQISIWDFFGIPRANYLTFSKYEKWRNVQRIL